MLSTLIWVPLLGAVVIGFWPTPVDSARSRAVALTVAGGALIWNIVLASQFDPTQTQMQFSEYIRWVEWLGLNYHLGLDGLSLSLIFLNSLLTVIAIISTNSSINRPRLYYAMLLLLSAGAAGAFLAQDLLLFFLFYELEIIPLYFLIISPTSFVEGYM